MSLLSDQQLGLHRSIPRRDFLNGIAVAATGVYGGASALGQSKMGAGAGADQPPARTGLRGEYPEAVAELERLRQGAYAKLPVDSAATDEQYDLVIVGGGISGLSAAHFWRGALGEDQRILILDNHDDFGGHAKRNEFHHGGKTYLGYGGTMSIATPYPYSFTAKQLLKDLTIEVERQAEFANRDLETKYSLRAGMFFDREHFLEDKLVVGNARQPGFFDQMPLSPEARRDLVRLHGKNPDYLPELSEAQKRARLARISYQDYLLNIAKINPTALAFFLGNGGRNNKRVDTTPALEAAQRGSPGFNGLGLKLDEGFVESSFTFHFPDGNATIARLLVARLIPGALSGPQTMQSIVQAPLDYGKLDQAGSPVSLRLRSTAVRVENQGSSSVGVAYLKGGKMHLVQARNCILACYNALIPSLAPEIPAEQKQALAYPAKVPMLYTNVLIGRWTAFQKAGVSRISSPGMYHPTCVLDPGTTVGGYRGVTTPDQPIVVHLVRNPNRPGLPRKEQNRLGQQELLSMTFTDFERKIRDQFARMLGPAGFDPAEDILAITANRWPNGYAYTYDALGDPDLPPEQRPHVIGRRRFGRVTIANSDAGAAAFTNQAIDEAHRAVQELLVLNGLT
ncbi:MAG: NAD(P)-binding protein [Acidobacteria bacterium]|nr:NAD(P)-binding protein [Acidobacteriota bacterium]